jgi:hypothetical protein
LSRKDILIALPVLLLLAGCYKPGIGEGDFICGPQGACPSGFHCLDDNRCYQNLQALDGGSRSDTPGATPPDMAAPGPDSNCVSGVTCSSAPPPGQICDPVCQTGCGCREKCAAPGVPPLCTAIPPKPADLYDECTGTTTGDDCRPGAVCASEATEVCGTHCYRACRSDDDCGPAARCKDDYYSKVGNIFLTKICSPRLEACNPVGASPECSNPVARKRPFPTFACYLFDAGKEDAAVCECAGSLELGQLCTGRHSCKPGLECLTGPGGDQRCRRLCLLSSGPGPGVECGVGTCRALGTSTRFGACF